MITPTLDTDSRAAVRAQAADDLRAIREQWGDLLAAIARPPAAEWPPRDSRAYIDGHLAEQAGADNEQGDEPTVGRLPLVLRQHPAPLNLAALDAALDAERELFALADQLAEQVQRPARDAADRGDPRRWHLPTHSASVTGRAASPGSRREGLHWACVWVEGRIVGDDVGDLFRAVPPRLLDHAAATVARARRTVERALGRDGRTTVLVEPCPWCGGRLTARTRSGGEPVVTCGGGAGCGAPVLLDRGRRTWRGADLVGLWVALEARRSVAT
ncbi:hypothetical protein [Streptomyces sp. enrichment culture]|uniref:hypothetical protein n=1 Tax=Streptomyces sp. enrichment culture TaxID=1795815 RepID=UPI003F5514FE